MMIDSVQKDYLIIDTEVLIFDLDFVESEQTNSSECSSLYSAEQMKDSHRLRYSAVSISSWA